MGTITNDRIYVIRDPNIYNKPRTYNYAGRGIITESSLYDVSRNLIQNGTQSEKAAALATLQASDGWYLKLGEAGEKILSRGTIFDNVLLITSFEPRASTGSDCEPGTGINYLYALNVENGGAVFNFQGLGSSGLPARKVLLKSKFLAPEPSIIIRGSKAQVCVGTECFADEIRFGSTVIRQFWRENR